ncbi:hypothetical protein FQZ97_689050 [compost metagenome]
MILAAELGALAVIQAFLVSFEPGLIDTTRYGIHFHAESRNSPGMDHVGSCYQKTHCLTNRHDDFIIDSQKTRITSAVFLAGSCTVRILENERIKADRRFGLIFVTPVPLIAGSLDRQRRIFGRILRCQKLK